jgi:nitrous oxide reductase accessory protein NosL
MHRKEIFITFLLFLIIAAMPLNGDAENKEFSCTQLDEKATGDMAKYSLHGEANGPIFFSGISCAIALRNKELCAMEMVSFDATSKVFDYTSGEEIDIGKAYFWVADKADSKPVLAFSSKEAAEKYSAEAAGGEVLDFTGLTDREF